jgi:hypothetical protein
MRFGAGPLPLRRAWRSMAFLHSASHSPRPRHHGHRQEPRGERRHDSAAGDPRSLDIGRARLEQAEARPRGVCSRDGVGRARPSVSPQEATTYTRRGPVRPTAFLHVVLR